MAPADHRRAAQAGSVSVRYIAICRPRSLSDHVPVVGWLLVWVGLNIRASWWAPRSNQSPEIVSPMADPFFAELDGRIINSGLDNVAWLWGGGAVIIKREKINKKKKRKKKDPSISAP